MRTSTTLLTLSLAVCLGGCSLVRDFDGYSSGEGGVDSGEDGSSDGGRTDSGMDSATDSGVDGATDSGVDSATDSGVDSATDSGVDSATDSGVDSATSACTPVCTGSSTCCGGVCVDTDSSLVHCGGCGVACDNAPNSTATCSTGTCTQACNADFQDCDGAAPGCESSTLDSAHCGRCTTACAAGQVCQDTASFGPVCVTSCTAGEMECAGSCVEINTDILHCGGCGMACALLPHTTRSCGGGDCVYACAGAFDDCNRDLMDAPTSDGCEVVPMTYYSDGDGDGVGAGGGTAACPGEEPSMSSTSTGDCDDMDANRFPGNPERCNGLDNDCDGAPDDGLNWMGTPLSGSCSCEAGARTSTVQCDASETAMCAFPAEVCNGFDDDCDGTPDNGFACVGGNSATCTVTLGTCVAIGARTCDVTFCSWGACTPPAETCDGTDEDCDGFIDEQQWSFGPASTLSAGFVGATAVGLHPGAGTGGAVTYMIGPGGSGSIQVVWQKLAEDTSLVGGPVLVDTISNGGGFGMGWDGGKWSIFYPTWTGSAWVVRHARVSNSGALTAPVDLGTSNAVGVTSDGTRVAVAYNQVAPLTTEVRAGVYQDGSWTRAFSTLLSGTHSNWVRVEPAGSEGFVAISTTSPGALIEYRSFNTSSMGTKHSTGIAGFAEAAFDPAGRLAMIISPLSGSAKARIYNLASGVVTGSHDFTRPQVRLGFASGSFFIDDGNQMQRMQPSDAMLFPESYTGELRVLELATWRGTYALLRSYAGGTSTGGVQGVRGCP